MTAILGGLGAAFAFACATVCSSRSSRLIGASCAVAWVALVGLVLIIPAVVASGRPALDAAAVGWLVVAGAGNAGGLLLSYVALRVGKVGLVAPIVSAEGAIAAFIALLAGEPLAAATAAALGVTAIGVVIASSAPSTAEARDDRAADGRSALLAIAAASSFGVSLYAVARIGQTLPIAWAVLPPRVVGVVAIALPLLLRGRLRLSARALPLVLVAGTAEVLGFVAFTLGARDDVAVSAVLSSLFGALAAVAARVLFAERLAPFQLVGVMTIVAGVVALSAFGS